VHNKEFGKLSKLDCQDKRRSNIRISVCMATYNGERYIEEQIKSILNQLSMNDEVIISDDNSTDNTICIIEKIKDNRIKIFYNHSQKGYTRNFENALKHSSGEVIFLSDQDDVWIEGKVENVLKELENSTLVVTDAEVTDGKLLTICNSHFKNSGVKQGFWINFIKTRYIGACLAFKRELLSKALPFPKNQSWCQHDYWITIVAELYYKVSLLRVPYIKYRRHGNNASNGGLTNSNNSFTKKIFVRIYCLFNLILRMFY